MAITVSAIPVLCDGTVSSTIVLSVRSEIACVTSGAVWSVLRVSGIRNKVRSICRMTVLTRGFTRSMIALVVATRVVVGVGVGAMVKCALIRPSGCCMTGVTIHICIYSDKVTGWLFSRTTTRTMTIGASTYVLVIKCRASKGSTSGMAAVAIQTHSVRVNMPLRLPSCIGAIVA